MSYFSYSTPYAELFKATRQTLALALPIIFTQVGTIAMSLVDTYFAGQLNTLELATVATGNSIFWTAAIILFGLFHGLDALMPKAHGQKNSHQLNVYLTQSIWLFLGLLGIGVVLIYTIIYGYHLTTTDPRVLANMVTYINTLMPTLLFVGLANILQKFWQSQGVVQIFTYIIIILNLLNIGLNYLLTQSPFGLPALGAQGIAVATSMCRLIGLLLVLGYSLNYCKHDLWLHLKHSWQINWHIQRQLLRLGLPTLGHTAVDVLTFNIAIVFIAQMSATALASHQIVFMLDCLILMVAVGFSSAAAIQTGQYLGQNNYARARAMGWLNIVLAQVFTIVLVAFVLIFNTIYLNIFTDDMAIIETALPIVTICALMQSANSLQMTAAGALRGYGNTLGPFYGNIITHYIIGMPMMLILFFYTDMGLTGIWLSFAAALSCSAVINCWLWIKA